MNNIGLEITFWVILSLYILNQIGVFKRKKEGGKESEVCSLHERFETQGSLSTLQELRTLLVRKNMMKMTKPIWMTPLIILNLLTGTLIYKNET